MTYKCKICGGSTTLDTKNGIAICEYCGTKQALPLFTDDSERLLYESGNNYLLHSEYDKAENVFNQLLTIKPNAAELYWDLVLCKYGVTYVKDPKTQKYIPTCNRTHYTPIFSDENYKKAVELSSGEKKALFENDAKTIDNIQKGIIAVSKKEKPFDIFISYKETGATGNRTKDSIEAQKLYEKLTEAGYKVFFSRITLEDKVGTEYEPYIYAALYSSKVMITVCSSKENIEAVWVKNEWSRFLGFRQNDNSKTLLPLYFDMQKSDLPDEFALLSAYDMQADGFIDELLRGIKKLIPLPIMKAKRRKKIRKTVGITAACICAVAIAVTAILLPKHIKAKNNQEDYSNAQTLYSEEKYDEAAKIFTELGDYKDSVEMIEKCTLQPKYDAATQLYYDGKYAEAAWAFGELGEFEDSVAQKEKAELSWRHDTASLIAYDSFNVYTSNNIYYIDANGSASAKDNGTPLKGISLKEHGKLVSLAPFDSIGAVHEDGYVSNLPDTTITDAVKVSMPLSYLDSRAVLHTNGKMSLSSPTFEGEKEEYLLENQRLWETTISGWNNIVDFECAYQLILYNEIYDESIIAIKSDGSLCGLVVYANANNEIELSTCEDILSKFSNVTHLKFTVENDYFGEGEFCIVALTSDEKLQIYKDGKFEERDATGIVDVVSTKELLTENGEIISLDKTTTIARDIVFADNDCTISRSGTISDDPKYRTTVQKEWIARLN